MEYKISLTGDIGSGKSTVGGILEKRCEARRYSTGPIVREIALSKGINVVDINKYMESDPNIDYDMDNRLKQLSYEKGSLIVDSRMAWFFTTGTFRVYLSTALGESARRVFNDKRDSEKFLSIEATAEQIKTRKASENARYFKLYGADCGHMANYDLVIDTTAEPAEAAAELIIRSYPLWAENKPYVKFYLCGSRIHPCATTGAVTKSTGKTVEVIFYNGEYYAATPDDQSEILSCIVEKNNHIPCNVVFSEALPELDSGIEANWAESLRSLGAVPYTSIG